MGREEKKEMLFWTTEEYKKFSEAVIDKPVSFYAFEMLYWTGMRLGELLALTMEDFDFEKNTVRINKSYQRLQGQDVITTPKTPKSNRTIKLPKFLAEEMQEYFAMLYDQTPTDRIFLVTKSFLHHEMERGCKLSGVKKIRIHDLRHSHISHLIDLGFSAVAIADRVGHESIDITYRYSHLFPSKQVAMADRLDAVNASFEDCEEQDDDVEREIRQGVVDGLPVDRLAVDEDLTLGGGLEAADDVQKGGLARAGGTHDAHELPLLHRQGHAAQGLGGRRPPAIDPL